MNFFTVPTAHSSCSTVYSSSAAIEDASSTSMSRAIRRVPGWSSSSEERSPVQSGSRFLLFDRDSKFGFDVLAAVRSLSLKPLRSSFQSPWQNGVADATVGYSRSLASVGRITATNDRHSSLRSSEQFRIFIEVECIDRSIHPHRDPRLTSSRYANGSKP